MLRSYGWEPEERTEEASATELVVAAFDNATGAAEMQHAQVELQKQRLVALDDATIVA